MDLLRASPLDAMFNAPEVRGPKPTAIVIPSLRDGKKPGFATEAIAKQVQIK
jgi:hypothetical protein